MLSHKISVFSSFCLLVTEVFTRNSFFFFSNQTFSKVQILETCSDLIGASPHYIESLGESLSLFLSEYLKYVSHKIPIKYF